MPSPRDTPKGVTGGARPFASAEDAWLWTMAALMARRPGAGPVLDAGAVARPCEPADVLACLDRLRRARRIDRDDIHFLRLWGQRGVAPGPHDPPSARRVWRELMAILHPELRQHRIVLPVFGLDGDACASLMLEEAFASAQAAFERCFSRQAIGAPRACPAGPPSVPTAATTVLG